MRDVDLEEARVALSALVEEGQAGAGIVITRQGRKEAVLVSWQEFERLKAVSALGRRLMSSPLGERDSPSRDAPESEDRDILRGLRRHRGRLPVGFRFGRNETNERNSTSPDADD